MAIVNGYITAAELEGYLGIADARDRVTIEDTVNDASRWVDTQTGRRFYADTTTSDRKYPVSSDRVVWTHDFYTTTGLVVKLGTSTLVLDADYQLEPSGIDMPEGFPWWGIRPLPGPWYSAFEGQTVITVTAKWGWAAVPQPIIRATKLQAAFMFASKDARFGVIGLDAGAPIRTKGSGAATDLLTPYRKSSTAVGLGLG